MKIVKRWSIVILLFSTAFFGCAPTQERHYEAGPGTTVIRPPLLPADSLDQKIGSLEDVLKGDGLSEKDKEIASALLIAYKSLKQVSDGEVREDEYRNVIRQLFQDLSYIEKNVVLKEKDRGRNYQTAIRDFTEKKRKIMDSYLAGNYREAINGSMELRSQFGPDALTPEIGLVLALSLAREGMLEEAVKTGEGILGELKDAPDLTLLKTSIADWKKTLSERAIASKPPVRAEPAPGVREALPPKVVDNQKEEVLQMAGHLIQDQKFDKARELLSFRRSELMLLASPAEEIQPIDRALKALDLAEEEHLQEKISMLSRDSKRRETMELALKLVEEENFEEAISRLDSLDPEEKSSPEVSKLKDRAVEMLINRERNRAAKIFLEAKKTNDLKKRQEYLLSSYNILKALVDKYPSSPLIEKVKSHIKVVKEELDKLAKVTS
jgi:hypothetical protein